MDAVLAPVVCHDSMPSGSHAIPDTVLTDVTENERSRAQAFRSFAFSHSLAHHPMMDLGNIRDVAGRMLKENRYDQVVCLGGAKPTAGDDNPTRRMHAALDALESIESSNSWLRLTRVDDVNGEFKAITDRFCDDISNLYGEDIRRQTLKVFVTLFISSPRAITAYHMDHTWNFLLQVRGSKTVYLFDPNDPRVLTQEDKERWYMERAPGIVLNDQPGGIGYDLAPGQGVHHPVNAPHWVQNGSDVSVSLSLGLCRHDSTRCAKIHQANYFARKLGFHPSEPDEKRWRDKAKIQFLELISRRHPRSFDDVLFSGKRRVDRLLKLGGIRL